MQVKTAVGFLKIVFWWFVGREVYLPAFKFLQWLFVFHARVFFRIEVIKLIYIYDNNYFFFQIKQNSSLFVMSNLLNLYLNFNKTIIDIK